MAYYRTDDSQGSLVSDSDPGDGWVEITEAEYDTLTGSFPNPQHDDIHILISELSLSPAAADALHRLFGQQH